MRRPGLSIRFFSILSALLLMLSFSSPQTLDINAADYVTRADVIRAVNKTMGIKTTKVMLFNTKNPEARATYGYMAAEMSKYLGVSAKSLLGKNMASANLSPTAMKSFLKKTFPNVLSKNTSKVKKGNVVIKKGSVTLSDAVVKGNVVIAKGAGNNKVVLKNVKISGNTVVNANAQIGGKIESLILDAPNINVNLNNCKVNKAVVNKSAKKSKLVVGSGSSVNKLTVKAQNVSVSGKNRIKLLNGKKPDDSIDKSNEVTARNGNINYNSENRWDEGYPKYEIPATGKYIYITYKLKDNVINDETTARIYNVVTCSNSDIDADTEAVVHGHLGVLTSSTDSHANSAVDKYDYLEISDANEHTVRYEMKYCPGRGFAAYSVLSIGEVMSDTPSYYKLDEASARISFDKAAPEMEYTVADNSGDKVYVYLSEPIDTDSIPSPACFSVWSLKNKIGVDSFTVHNGVKSAIFDNYLVLNLKKRVDTTKRYYVGYSQPLTNPIRDMAPVPNKMSSASVSEEITKADLSFESVCISEDGEYLKAVFNGSVDSADISRCRIYLGTKEVRSYNYIYNHDEIEFTAWNLGELNLTADELTNITYRANDGNTIKNRAGDTVESVKCPTNAIDTVGDVSIVKAAYFKTSGRFMLFLNNGEQQNNVLLCHIVVNADGSNCRLRGGSDLNGFSGESIITFGGKGDISVRQFQTQIGSAKEMSLSYEGNQDAADRGNIRSRAGKPMESTNIEVQIYD